MHATDEQLAAFLAGELDPDAARAVDEHLLECERCWQSVCAARLGRRAAERLRQPTPASLADRIQLAIELAPNAAPNAAPARRPRARRGRWTAMAAATAALVGAIVLAALLVPQHTDRTDPPVISALVHLAAQPTPRPAAESSPATTQLGGQVVVLRRYPVDGGTAVVVTSAQAFPTPPGAQTQPGSSMAWTITRAMVTVYCPRQTVLVAGPVPASTLAALAGRLHLN